MNVLKPLTVENALRIQDQIKQIMAMDERVLGIARRGQEQARYPEEPTDWR